eukprot:scaffold7232_cov63-Cyclotella_meneghiniana.AAC.9
MQQKVHTSVCPFYLLTPKSPRFSPRAVKPSVRRGCVDKRKSPYVRKAPLPTQDMAYVLSTAPSKTT